MARTLPTRSASYQKSLDAGMTVFDTADGYSSGDFETMLGRALEKRRREVVIATKVFEIRTINPPQDRRRFRDCPVRFCGTSRSAVETDSFRERDRCLNPFSFGRRVCLTVAAPD
jgi:aryl-alcohol dehydrogenase-like predicted oxidoreductase